MNASSVPLVKRTLQQNKKALAGFAFLWIWVWSVFQSSVMKGPQSLLMENEYLSQYWNLAIWVAPLLSYALGFAALGLAYYFRRVIPQSRAYRASMPLLMVGGLLCVLLSYPLQPLGQPLAQTICLAGALAMGVGTAFIHTEWGRISAFIGLQRTMVLVACATVPAGIVLAGMAYLPTGITAAVMAASAIASSLIAFSEAPLRKPITSQGKEVKLHFSAKLMATAFVQGSSLGAIEILLEGSSKEVSLGLSVGGFILGAILVLAICMRFRPDFDRLLYCLGFPAMAAGCILITIFAPSVAAGGVVHAIGYRFVDVLIWALMAYVMSYNNQPANWVTSIATLWLIAGQFCGIFACWLFTTELGLARGVECGGAFIAFALMLCAVLAANSQNMRTGWGLIKPVEGEEELDTFDICCQALAKEYQLTGREAEVFGFLAKGYPRQYICEKLVLADGTVKSHIRHIYQKMDIHSRNDAITLVEQRAESYDSKQ